MQKGWILNNTYYLNEDGIMLSGWQTIDDAQYYFDGSGKKLTNCWIGNSYVLSDGKSQKINGLVITMWMKMVFGYLLYILMNGRLWMERKSVIQIRLILL